MRRNSRGEGRNSRERGRAAWLVPCVHGTPTIKLWSFDVRSGGPSQATLLKGYEQGWWDH
jgi:hypothetical protein